MQSQPANEPFRLSPLPGELWDMARMIDELQADDQTIRRWVREGRIPGPCLRHNGRAFWDPADVASFRRKRLRRIGAETGEAVGLGDPTASGDSRCGKQSRKVIRHE
jgi:hypothetical protein